VIGDSLAAGVGQRVETADGAAVAPVLPQSIATALSGQLGGRAVYWTCVGTPGLSATEIVDEIHQLHAADSNYPAAQIVRTLLDWQADRRAKAQQRIEVLQQHTKRRWKTMRERAAYWAQQIGKPVVVSALDHTSSERHETEPSGERSKADPLEILRKRLMRAKLGVGRDVRNFLRIFYFDARDKSRADEGYSKESPSPSPVVLSFSDEPSMHAMKSSDKGSGALQEQHSVERKVNRMIHRNSLDPNFVKQYDVAVVLTGLNDLKDSFLPFMMSAQRARMLEQARVKQSEDAIDREKMGLFKSELLRIIRVLRDTVLKSLPSGTSTDHSSSSTTPNMPLPRRTSMERRSSLQRSRPLIVFPALPLAPIELSRLAPLSWFVVPIVRAMDRNKQALAEMYPDMVLFVPSPQSTVFSDAEAKRGPLWESFATEKVLLKLTDISSKVQRRLDELLTDTVYDDGRVYEDNASFSLYEMREDGVALVKRHRASTPQYPGASMVSQDGIHPNDHGYELWGKYIARVIVEHWEKEKMIDVAP
jgi:hypothetical protein